MARILVTGCAGFIGMHTSERLLERGDEVVGIDNLNAYYDVTLKESRLARLTKYPGFTFCRADIADRVAIARAFESSPPSKVINLAAQAGVRYSLENPHAYVDSNLVGFVNILEACRHTGINHLVYASSSSVYGSNAKLPFSVKDNVDHPVSLYAATKKANELMAHVYTHLYHLPTTGLRFFTVYGPWGRPDMALFIFTKAILAGEPIQVFNFGKMRRDFTYIDDIVTGVIRVLDLGPGSPATAPDVENTQAPYRLYNIGNSQPEDLLRMIEILENCLNRKAEKNFQPIQPGDVPATFADVDDLVLDVGFQPSVPIEIGIPKFVQWYREFYRV
jgi:UDP-glucuronate 4-epimerase